MILITGAGGFVGRHLISRLRMEGSRQIIPLYRSKRFTFGDNGLFMDLADTEHVRMLSELDLDVNRVIHLAGELAKPDLSLSQLYKSNILSTVNLLEYCSDTGVGQIIFSSSYKIYGFPTGNTVTEESPLNPLDHYSLSKVCCEEILKLASTDGLSIMSFRFPSIYSEENAAGAVFNFCMEAIQKGTITIKATVPTPFDAININDVVSSLLCAVSKPPVPGYSAYNISTGKPNSLIILADLIASLVPECRVYYPETPQPVRIFDSTKARHVFGWKPHPPKIHLRRMLKVMAND